jgi:diguanylate cyclase (GGDEF)-like protein
MVKKKKILIVDDNQVNRSLLRAILQSAGYATEEAENGLSAYRLLCQPVNDISLVLLDISMPIMDGHALLQKMVDTGLITYIPVIITTGDEDVRTELSCLENGASDYIKKPYHAELVCHRVGSLLRLWDNAKFISGMETDRLTGVYTREFFYRRAEAILDNHPDEPYYIIYTDVDDFKIVNAHYGTAAGDDLLRYLAGIYQHYVGEHGLCGRIGADTFVLLCRLSDMCAQAQLLSAPDDQFGTAPVRGFHVKCGVYAVSDRKLAVSDMCDRAKMAMATIKHQYGTFYAVYDESIRDRALRQHQLVDCMEEALVKGQFEVYLQPKHSTQSGAVAGAEALVRWNHPELGFIAPDEFISLFEQNGFIVKLDNYVWTEVCRILKHWRESGISPVPISVNASRLDFAVKDLPEKITKLVASYEIPPELLHFEVTESAYTGNPQQIIAAVSRLREAGFLIEMDDFGSGYSSLNMLSELPIDILKLDMRFMKSDNDRAGGSKRNILSFVLSLSKWLQLPTVAEGVETEAELEQLRTMGCDLIQGYYFAKPMPVAEFETYLRKHMTQQHLPKPAAAPAVSTGNTADDRRPLVLVVEDVARNCQVMCRLLEPYYRVVTAESGKTACAYIDAHEKELSCILLDLLKPVMDGFQVLEHMRASGSMGKIPVIITTEAGEDCELRALHLGADSFVAKPYHPKVLLHHVKKAVEQKCFLEVQQDFEQQRHSLYEKAYRDELTGLLNRYGLKAALDELSPGSSYAVIMLDVDNFKRFNDTYGHGTGDRLIRAVADTLNHATREGDVLARVGGDEFIVLLRNIQDAEAAQAKGRQLCRAIQNTQFTGSTLKPSCSAGVAIISGSDGYEEAYFRADQALYQAKRHRKGTCALWSPDADHSPTGKP